METLTVAPHLRMFFAISSTAGRFLMLGSRFRIPSIIWAVILSFGFILLGAPGPFGRGLENPLTNFTNFLLLYCFNGTN